MTVAVLLLLRLRRLLLRLRRLLLR
ncbi:uncharacterized protein METZ01_LOCUS79102, partial [marine metagenome]